MKLANVDNYVINEIITLKRRFNNRIFVCNENDTIGVIFHEI
jgi:hypothetical protein